MKYQVGDIVRVKRSRVFPGGIRVGDLAIITDPELRQMRFITGTGAGTDQINSGGDGIELHYRSPRQFEPYHLVLETRAELEILKAIMHLRIKVSDSSYFSLPWTPDPLAVSKFMKELYTKLDQHSPGWMEYSKEKVIYTEVDTND